MLLGRGELCTGMDCLLFLFQTNNAAPQKLLQVGHVLLSSLGAGQTHRKALWQSSGGFLLFSSMIKPSSTSDSWT